MPQSVDMRSLLLCAALCACGSANDVGDGGEPLDAGRHDSNVATDGSRGLDADSFDSGVDPDSSDAAPAPHLQTVFIILMENHSWSTISGSSNANYINNTLVPMGGHATAYNTPKGNHPSEPNYIWLEAGDNLGITDDGDPSANHQSTTDHLVTQLQTANISWRVYPEGMSGADCPLTGSGAYAPKHVPQLYFDDVTNTNDSKSKNCIAHVKSYTTFHNDLTANLVARYNFIVPNLCNDMHGLSLSCGLQNFGEIGAGDAWLQAEVPKILASNAYKNNGVLFILWDEGDESIFGTASDGPIPMLVISPLAKKGYSSPTVFTHSSMLRTLQEIFGVSPFLRDAKSATDLSEFFTTFP